MKYLFLFLILFHISVYAGEWDPVATLQVQEICNPQLSPDNQRIVYCTVTVPTDGELDHYESHLVMVELDTMQSYAFTHGPESAYSPQWSPDGQHIAYLSGKDLWIIRANGGQARRITDAPVMIYSFKWAPDSQHIAFVMSDPCDEGNEVWIVDEDLCQDHLWLLNINDENSLTRLTEGDFSVNPDAFDWSPDGQTIVFAHQPSPRPCDSHGARLSLLNLECLITNPLLERAPGVTAPFFSPDGKSIAYLSVDNDPYWAIRSTIEIVSNEGELIRRLALTPDEFPSPIGWSDDGDLFYVIEESGTRQQLIALPVDGSAPILVDTPGSVISHLMLSADRKSLIMAAESSEQPSEGFILNLSNGDAAQFTTLNDQLPLESLSRTERVSWHSVDGLEIEGLLTYPAGYQEGIAYPLVLLVHGGPMGSFQERFIAKPWSLVYPIAALADEGYAVLRCNVRGSSGYGPPFRLANYADWGGMDYLDLMSGIDALISRGIVDPSRLAVFGWSYGGYLSATIITKTDRFKAACVGAGVSNLISMTGTSDVPDVVPAYFGIHYWESPEVYLNHSPIFYVQGVTTPTLILHGEHDRRVPIAQAYELHNALKSQDIPVKMVVYPRTAHSPREPRLQLDIAERIIAWFNQHVKEQPSAVNAA